jgi:serine phosphatase RsbU (regulator of sigma subunit)
MIPSSLPVGISEGTAYEEMSVVLGEGDRLVCFTDGLAESRGVGGVMFETVLPGAVAGVHDSPEELLERLIEAERRHRGAGTLRDDLTVLVGGFE